mgnify:CR=1 FL=1
MSISVLDINDSNLQLWHEGTTVQSPGYVLFQEKEYRFGSPARAAARLQPRDINTRYWWQLSTETLQPALGPARHTGDLAHAHLSRYHTHIEHTRAIGYYYFHIIHQPLSRPPPPHHYYLSNAVGRRF